MSEPGGLYGHHLLDLIVEVEKGEPVGRMFSMSFDDDVDSAVKLATDTLVRRSTPSGTELAVKVDNKITYLDGGRRKVDVWVTITKASGAAS